MLIKRILECAYWHVPKYVLPFDVYQRYRFISELIVLMGGKSVLDVGAGEGIIRRFLKEKEILTLDLNHGDVLGSGINLPFKGDSFDVVTAIDVLEHIPKNIRSLFVQELIRVARSYVIIAAPFKNSRIQQVEYELNNFYNKYSEDSPWLKEHIKYDLPDLESLKEKEEKVKVFNIMHLKRFQFIAELKTIVRKIPFSFIIECLINLFYNFLFYRLDTSNPTNHYRKVILIKKCYVNILRARHC